MLKREHKEDGKRKPSDFLLRDDHEDVLSDVEFKHLWWNIQENMNSSIDFKMVMSIIQNCAAHRVLHIKQLMSVIKLFDSVGDRLEILELFVLRCHKLMYKSDLVTLFTPILRPYVSTILQRTMLVEPMAGIPQGAFLCRNKVIKDRLVIKGVVAALERVHYNQDNQAEVVMTMLRKDAKPMSHRQAYKILRRFVDDCETI